MRLYLINFLFLILITVFSFSCENPAKNKTEAITRESNSQETAKQTNGESIKFSETNSKISFVGSKVTGKESGGFKTFSGNINLVNKKPEESQVSVEIDMTSVYTEASGLADHLKTADFFEVEKYPKATFISSKITADKSKGENNYNVTGDLDFHGVKKTITFPAKIVVENSGVQVTSEFFINRRDFNINYGGRANDLIRDEVVLNFDIKASAQK